MKHKKRKNTRLYTIRFSDNIVDDGVFYTLLYRFDDHHLQQDK